MVLLILKFIMRLHDIEKNDFFLQSKALGWWILSFSVYILIYNREYSVATQYLETSQFVLIFS